MELEDLKKLIEESAAENRRQFKGIDAQFKGIDAQFKDIDAQFKDMRRHFDIVAEESKHRDQLLAEGIGAANDRIDQLPTRSEVNEQFDEVRATIRLSHTQLERRIRTLEDDVANLQSRVERIENALNQ